tara:strand:- start:525 stop:743 length:219 start_codon:yes stop_codon:yes gene_type:complete
MKFILILWVCSFTPGGTNCFPPIKLPTLYDSWYECSRDAHKESVKVLSTIGFKRVNDMQMGTKYHCKETFIY